MIFSYYGLSSWKQASICPGITANTAFKAMKIFILIVKYYTIYNTI
jgi:hypothetical protein